MQFLRCLDPMLVVLDGTTLINALCEKEIYDNWVKSHPTAKGLRNKPFPFLEELSVAFGRDRANGQDSESPADAAERITEEGTNADNANPEDTDNAMDEHSNGGNSTDSQTNSQAAREACDNPRMSKRRRTPTNEDHSDSMTSCMLSMQEMFRSANENVGKLAGCFQFMQDEAARKQKVFQELLKMESIPFDDRLVDGAIITGDTNKTNYFFSLDEGYRQHYVQMTIDGRI